MADKKGKNIVCLNMEKVTHNLCDYFVICQGDSSVQVETIAKWIEERVYELTGEHVYHREGHENAEWILLDYLDVVVHIFQPAARKFYNLEGLWGDAETEMAETQHSASLHEQEYNRVK